MGSRSGAIGRGLKAADTTASGALIAYATDPDNVALDGSGADSPFSEALARHLADQGLDVRQMLTRVRADVQKATDGHQRPWVSESLNADFYFSPAAIGQAAEPVPLKLPSDAPPALPKPTPADASQQAELVFWQSIANSTNRDDFLAYLAQFLHGPFAPLARNRLALIAPVGPAPIPPSLPRAPPEPQSAMTPDTEEAALSIDPEQWSLIQQALGAVGQSPGRPDGVPGELTRQAVRQFQKLNGFAETGYFVQAQIVKLLRHAREPLARAAQERAAAEQSSKEEHDRLAAATMATKRAEVERRAHRWRRSSGTTREVLRDDRSGHGKRGSDKGS